MTLPPVVSRTNVPTPPGNATTTTLQVGTYNAVTDTFTLVLDLNDASNFYMKPQTLKLPQAPKQDVRSFNIRTPGERIVRTTRKNITASWSFSIRGANAAAISTNIRNFVAAVESPPYVLRIALPGASFYSYLDVRKAVYDIPGEPIYWNAKALVGCTVAFECGPYYRGDRLTMQNLAVNPGFEAPSGPGVNVFLDGFANTNAYTTYTGSSPSVTSNVMTIPLSAGVTFGSPNWGPINLWQVRFQAATSMTAYFMLHRVDANNQLRLNVTLTQIQLQQAVAGTVHVIATSSSMGALTNGTFYWVQLFQFPSVAGNPPFVQAIIFNDSSGTLGSQVTNANIAGFTFDAVTALSGKPAIEADGAALAIGGAFVSVHGLNLFGPGGWSPNSANSTSVCSCAWDTSVGNSANPNPVTYPNGPVTSFGAARIDLAPTGSASAYWISYPGGAPAGTSAMPVQAAGNVIAVSAYTLSSGLNGSNGQTVLQLYEYNASGTQLRATTVVTLTGNQASWTQMSGTVTTGANCTYVAVRLVAQDLSGTSGNGIVWFDNVEVWNQTTCAQTSMPYCEMRFPQSPAQLLLSGIQGDAVTPAIVAMGTFNTISAADNVIAYLARRAQAGAGAQLVGVSSTPGFSGTTPFVLDSKSLGGFDTQSTAVVYNTLPIFFEHDYIGTYHLFWRFQSAQSVGNLPNVTVFSQTREIAGNTNTPTYNNPPAAPLSASNTWTAADTGQITIPLNPDAGVRDSTLIKELVILNSADTTGGGPAAQSANWFALLPIDGSILIIKCFNPGMVVFSGGAGGGWTWLYVIGGNVWSTPSTVSLGFNYGTWQASALIFIGPLPDLTRYVGGTGSSSVDGLNPTADPYLTLDPTVSVNGVAGINQLVGLFADTLGTQGAMALYTELYYSPWYLYPR